MTNRREFVLKLVPLAGVAAVLPRVALADVPALTEADPMAKAMGFRLDTNAVDMTNPKFKNHTKDQSCAKCVHYTTPGADTAKCDLFSKSVPKGGWCTGFSARK